MMIKSSLFVFFLLVPFSFVKYHSVKFNKINYHVCLKQFTISESQTKTRQQVISSGMVLAKAVKMLPLIKL